MLCPYPTNHRIHYHGHEIRLIFVDVVPFVDGMINSRCRGGSATIVRAGPRPAPTLPLRPTSFSFKFLQLQLFFPPVNCFLSALVKRGSTVSCLPHIPHLIIIQTAQHIRIIQAKLLVNIRNLL